MKGRKLPEEVKIKIYESRINDKLLYREIAEKFGIDTNSIGPIFKEIQKKLETKK